jgi:hypothetical protein
MKKPVALIICEVGSKHQLENLALVRKLLLHPSVAFQVIIVLSKGWNIIHIKIAFYVTY